MAVSGEKKKSDSTLGGLRLTLAEGQRMAHFDTTIVQPGISYVGRTRDNAIVLDSDLVSRRHAKLLMTDGGLTLHDLDSHNGVFRNGIKIRSEKLNPGDAVYFGDVCVKVEEISDEEMYSWLNLESGLSRSDALSEVLSDVQKKPDDPALQSLSVLLRAIDGMLQGNQEEFLDTMLHLCLERTGAPVGVIVEMTESGELLTHSKYWEFAVGESGLPIHWQLVKRCISEEKVLSLSPEPENEEKISSSQASYLQHMILCVPVIREKVTIGAIYISRPEEEGGFDSNEVEVIAAFGHIVASRMGENNFARSDVESKKTSAEDADVALGQEVEELRTQLQESKALCKKHEKAMETLPRLERELQALDEKCANAEMKQKDTQIQFETANQMLQSTAAEADKLHAQLEILEGGEGFIAMAKQCLFPAVFDRITTLSQNSDAVQDVQTGERTALCFSLSGVDALLEERAMQDIRGRLDQFCEAVWKHTNHHDGQIEQNIGKLQMLLFAGDQAGTRSAINCARAVLQEITSGDAIGVQCGIHVGDGVSGFFGKGAQSLLMHIGHAVAISRGACEYCPPGQIYATEAVRQKADDMAECLFVAAGPHLIRGLQQPVNLFQLTKG